MTFLGRRGNKYRFKVVLGVSEIKDVPFATGHYFFKIRLLEGGNFEVVSRRSEIVANGVSWEEQFEFECRMGADSSSRVLDDCRCRISFRRETKGGRGKDKLGFVDLNLSEHAAGSPDVKPSSPSSPSGRGGGGGGGGGGGSSNTISGSSATLSSERLHSYLFRGYNNSEQRDANYILKMRVKMTLLAGDLVFKTPTPTLGSGRIPDHMENLDGTMESSTTSTSSSSRGGGGGGFSRMGHWMSSTRRRSWLRDMLKKEDSIRKKSEWYLHPNLEAEGSIVRALETEENMADSISTISPSNDNDNNDNTPTNGASSQLQKQSPQRQQSTLSEEQTTTQLFDRGGGGGGGGGAGGGGSSESKEPHFTPERPPRRKDGSSKSQSHSSSTCSSAVKCHSRQTSASSSSVVKGHSRQTSITSSISGYSSLASNNQPITATMINCDLDGAGGFGGGSVDSLQWISSSVSPTKDWKNNNLTGSGVDLGSSKYCLDSAVASFDDEDFIKAVPAVGVTPTPAKLSALTSAKPSAPTPAKLASTPTSLRSKAFFSNFSEGVSSSSIRSRNERFAETRVSSDEVVEELLSAGLA